MHIYDDGGLPGEGGGRCRCPVDCIHGCPECLGEEPEVTLDDAPACPVHGRDWLAIVDDEVACAAPCPSTPDYLYCPWREEIPDRDYASVAEAADAIRRGDPPPDGPAWLRGALDDLAIDLGVTRHLTDEEAGNA